VETPALDGSSVLADEARLGDGARDLLPWADPYITKLLAKHRLQAALDDSLEFLSDGAGNFGTTHFGTGPFGTGHLGTGPFGAGSERHALPTRGRWDWASEF